MKILRPGCFFFEVAKNRNRNTKVTKCHLFQEQSETFRTGSLCLATTQETLSGEDDDCDEEDDDDDDDNNDDDDDDDDDEEDHDGDDGDAGDEDVVEEMIIIFVDDKIV